MAPRNTGTSSSATILPFPRRNPRPDNRRILRIIPDFDGNCLLYRHYALSREKLFAIKILAWAQLADLRFVALVPWLTGISRCSDLQNPEDGQSQGYYAPGPQRTFSDIPPHYRAALAATHTTDNSTGLMQEIPDLVGTHAAMIRGQEQAFSLEPVVSWQLFADGRLDAMVADTTKATQLPVLPGDPCLYSCEQSGHFRYYFQYHIANQIKAGGQIATRALQQLLS